MVVYLMEYSDMDNMEGFSLKTKACQTKICN
jgi:hypothetical protein